MEEEKIFVRLLADNILIGDTCYAATSVAEVPKSIGKRLIESKHAEAHGGPAWQPPPAPDPKPAEPLERAHVKTEKAVK
ncbi:MAG TPA: hypothetical protein VKB78_16680 [Pirellulales bacterium]|nr:hypothetical protein [Pirellulales bacterium]